MSDYPFALPDNAPFGHQQKVALNALLPSLNAQQAAWLSGYFAGAGQSMGAGSEASAVQAPVAVAAPAASTASVPLTILFGSESGNAEKCAEDLGVEARKAGFKPVVVDMADYDRSKLGEEKHVFVVVSTWGEGDPPERASDFHEFVMGESAPRMESAHFSVCALGDTSYADFCECGKQFDRRFSELGGSRIHDRVDCDVDFDEPFQTWMKAALAQMVEVSGVNEVSSGAESQSAVVDLATGGATATLAQVAPAPVDLGYGKKNPFPAPLKERINLNGNGSAKETMHLEISLEGSGLTYDVGDALAVIPQNCPEVVDDLVRLAGFRGDELLERDEGLLSFSEVLQSGYDITSLNPSFMKKYAPFAKSRALDDFLKDENKEKRSEWLWGRELRDLLLEYPIADSISPEQFLGILRKMPPRLYSIASSLKAHPEEVHLTVGVVRYDAHGKARKGVCSTYLAERIEKAETMPVYVHHNKNFFLPEDPDTPIIMVGPGTGIAPFRAFVEERAAMDAGGKNWLFFGDQHFSTDFLYQTEWQGYLKSGLLTKMNVAFSRDTEHKVYVQHRMKENAKELYEWMQAGAYFYVCGDASRMAKDVNQALIEIYNEVGGLSLEDAESEVKQLIKTKRYQRDVY